MQAEGGTAGSGAESTGPDPARSAPPAAAAPPPAASPMMRQPSLSSQVMASPSPAMPDAPWAASRQYLPGSQQVPSLLCGWQSACVVAAAGGGGSGRRGCRGGDCGCRGGCLRGDRGFLWPCFRTRRVARRRPAGYCRAGGRGDGDGGSVVGPFGVSASAGDPPDDDDQRGQAAEHGQYGAAPWPRIPCGPWLTIGLLQLIKELGFLLVPRQGSRLLAPLCAVPPAQRLQRDRVQVPTGRRVVRRRLLAHEFPLPRGTDSRALL
jgi:hypothetical protein